MGWERIWAKFANLMRDRVDVEGGVLEGHLVRAVGGVDGVLDGHVRRVECNESILPDHARCLKRALCDLIVCVSVYVIE